MNSKFSFFSTGCLTKAKEPNLPYYLFIIERGKNTWIHVFPEMQTDSSKI